MKTKTKAWVNLVMLGITLVVNFLGATGKINGTSQAEVSNSYQTLITPAGFTFSIWSVIYTLLVISMITLLVKSKDSYYTQVIERMSPLLWLSYLTNIIWIVLFSYRLVGLSTIFIFAYLFSLSGILIQLKNITQERQWLLGLTFGLNTGWLFIASVVNVAAFLIKIEWNGFGLSYSNWAIIIMIVSLLLAFFVSSMVKNAAFPLPIAWAFFGIFMELQKTEGNGLLGIIAIVCMLFLVLLSVISFRRNRNSIFPVI